MKDQFRCVCVRVLFVHPSVVLQNCRIASAWKSLALDCKCPYISMPSRMELKMGQQVGSCSSTNLLLCSWPVRLDFCSMPRASSVWFPPGTTSKTSGGVTQHVHPAVEARGFRVKCEEHQGCSNHHVNLENSRDHQALLDLRWPLDRSYVFWSSVLMVGCPTGAIKT